MEFDFYTSVNEKKERVKLLRSNFEKAGYKGKIYDYPEFTPPVCPLYLGNQFFLGEYTRIVYGGHGPYIEFKKSEIPLICKEGEEYRKFYKNCKYEYLVLKGFEHVKVYLQKSVVSYADYKPGLYYVDLLYFI